MPTRSKTPRVRRKIPRKPRVRKGVSFNQRVKNVFLRELETKKVSTLLGGATHITPINITSSGLADTGAGVHIGNIFNTNNIKIEQGVQQDQRVGRKIENCKLYLKACVQATFYNPATNTNQYPFDVYCIVYKDKQSPNTSSPDFLKLNTNGDPIGMNGEPTKFMLPFNKARYTIYTNRKIATFKPMPVDRPEPIASNLQNPTIGSSDNKAFKYFSMKLPCPKTLEFKGSSGNTGSDLISNAHLSVCFYVVNGSGTALGATQVRATITPITTLYFKDG